MDIEPGYEANVLQWGLHLVDAMEETVREVDILIQPYQESLEFVKEYFDFFTLYDHSPFEMRDKLEVFLVFLEKIFDAFDPNVANNSEEYNDFNKYFINVSYIFLWQSNKILKKITQQVLHHYRKSNWQLSLLLYCLKRKEINVLL
jgi:hypothetical protein